METRNSQWGFYGTSARNAAGDGDPTLKHHQKATDDYAAAHAYLMKAGHFSKPEHARDYLDSKSGRHLADQGKPLEQISWVGSDVKSFKKTYNPEHYNPTGEARLREAVEIAYRLPGKGGFQRKVFPSDEAANKWIEKQDSDIEVRWAADCPECGQAPCECAQRGLVTNKSEETPKQFVNRLLGEGLPPYVPDTCPCATEGHDHPADRVCGKPGVSYLEKKSHLGQYQGLGRYCASCASSLVALSPGSTNSFPGQTNVRIARIQRPWPQEAKGLTSLDAELAGLGQFLHRTCATCGHIDDDHQGVNGGCEHDGGCQHNCQKWVDSTPGA
jgi:hypothetical protein